MSWAEILLKQTGVHVLVAAGFLLLAAFCLIPMDAAAQLPATAALLAIMWYGRVAADGDDGEAWRILVLVLGVFVSLRYLAWRGVYTLHARDAFSMVAVLMLFVAELYSAIIHVLGCMVNTSPLERPLLSLTDLPEGTVLPMVDVMVPSYNEDAQMLEVTLRAARMMRYPADRLRVHLLDDGGTDQKLSQANEVAAAAARKRRETLQELCSRLGVSYITRARNEHAKAGNVNNGIEQTDGDLVVILDADHVPTLDFLDHTVPWFVLHEKVFLVQTPHFMINPDPIDRNLLQGFRRMPSENDMFYQTIQRGLDFWSSSFFCGSAAVLRRKCLEEVGGLSGDSITEDAETALRLHCLGYESVYVAHPMVAGLAPETFTGFVIQRMRWAQGMVQILLLKRPFMAPGLTWYQRVGYMSSIMFWLFPFARVTFLTAPLAYLLFGMDIYSASMVEMLAYTVPHIIGTYIISNLLFGRTRWPMISELYEVMQCLFSLVAIIKVLINPHEPSFVVTPKGDTLDDDFVSPLARPFHVLFFCLFLGFAGGAWRLWVYPLTRDLTTVVLMWNLFNFLTTFAALGALMERRQRRSAPRMPASEDGTLLMPDGQEISCFITDLSAGGARLVVRDLSCTFERGSRIFISIYSQALGRPVCLPLFVRAVIPRRGSVELGAQFDASDSHDADEAVIISFGDSGRWAYFLQRRSRDIPFGRALWMIVSLIWKPVSMHFSVVSQSASARLRDFRAALFSARQTNESTQTGEEGRASHS